MAKRAGEHKSQPTMSDDKMYCMTKQSKCIKKFLSYIYYYKFINVELHVFVLRCFLGALAVSSSWELAWLGLQQLKACDVLSAAWQIADFKRTIYDCSENSEMSLQSF